MDYATQTLIYYIKTLWEGSGLEFSADCHAEVEGIVESLTNESAEKARKAAAQQINKDNLANFRKIAAAICLQGLISNQWRDAVECEVAERLKEGGENIESIAQIKSKAAVFYADALIKELSL